MASGLVVMRAPSPIWLILLYLPYITKLANSESVRAPTLVKLDQMTRNDPKESPVDFLFRFSPGLPPDE